MLTVPGHNPDMPEEFRKYFWDVDYDDLSLEKYPKFIAERIPELWRSRCCKVVTIGS